MEIITDDQDFTQDWLREGQVLGCVTTVKQALRGCKVPLLPGPCTTGHRAVRPCGGEIAAGLTPHNFRDILHRLQPQGRSAGGIRRASLPPAAGVAQSAVRAEFRGQVRAVLAGWGVSVVPELLVRGPAAARCAGRHRAGHARAGAALLALLEPESAVLDQLTTALSQAARRWRRPEGQRGIIPPCGRAVAGGSQAVRIGHRQQDRGEHRSEPRGGLGSERLHGTSPRNGCAWGRSGDAHAKRRRFCKVPA